MTEAFDRLLRKKMDEAKEAMQYELDKQLFGDPDKKTLKEIITDAYDAHTEPVSRVVVSPKQYEGLKGLLDTTKRYTTTDDWPKFGFETLKWNGVPVTVADQVLKENYIKPITDQLFGSSPLLDKLKGSDMTVTSEIRSDMNRKKEVKRVKKQLRRFEGSWLYKLKDGAHIGFTVRFEEGGTEYNYAAVLAGRSWHLTGVKSGTYTTDGLVDWLIENGTDFKGVKLYKPVK